MGSVEFFSMGFFWASFPLKRAYFQDHSWQICVHAYAYTSCVSVSVLAESADIDTVNPMPDAI